MGSAVGTHRDCWIPKAGLEDSRPSPKTRRAIDEGGEGKSEEFSRGRLPGEERQAGWRWGREKTRVVVVVESERDRETGRESERDTEGKRR